MESNQSDQHRSQEVKLTQYAENYGKKRYLCALN